ncbi:MAG: ferredoxin [Deltaproteobacteria bacterium]|nr:MAG: ferredoxin [Deltaproteobacteria bacterium]
MRGFDPHHPDFYDLADLESEMDRIYDICHGCRLCFSLCPSFPALFDAIDESEEEAVSALTWEQKMRVVDLCYNCKLCFPKCPYTPPHEFELDFPALMLRAKAAKAKHQGIRLGDKFLGNPMLVGKIGGVAPTLVNALNAPGTLNRKVMEKTLGLEADRHLPPIASEPFERWWKRRGGSRPSGKKQGTVALFYTCSLNYNWPGAAKALVEVLEHNGFEVHCPEQRCCGMPALDGGDIEQAIEWAHQNLDGLHAAVRDGMPVIIPGPSCSLMIKHDYPTLTGEARAQEVARHTYDAAEFLLKMHKEGKLSTDFSWHPEVVAYHQPCHLKVQNFGLPARDLLRLTGAKVKLVDKCSGMDGTWGMKHEFFELSMKQAKKLAGGLERAKADLLVSDCPLASLQVEEVLERRPLHPVEVLHRAYGLSAAPKEAQP